MTKERQSHREPKKQPAMTLKEKRKAKKSKQGDDVGLTVKTASNQNKT